MAAVRAVVERKVGSRVGVMKAVGEKAEEVTVWVVLAEH